MIFLNGRKLAAKYVNVIWIHTHLRTEAASPSCEPAAGGSVTTSKTLSDFIKPFIERVKSGMQAFVVKVKYAANY
jgi:hypothetical protein